jgi:hypothetical protein
VAFGGRVEIGVPAGAEVVAVVDVRPQIGEQLFPGPGEDEMAEVEVVVRLVVVAALRGERDPIGGARDEPLRGG